MKERLRERSIIRNHPRRRAPTTSQRELVEKDKCPWVKILNPHMNQDTWQKEINQVTGERHPFPGDERLVEHKSFLIHSCEFCSSSSNIQKLTKTKQTAPE